jgi:coenzyme Q-binding protein COQ10
MTTHRETREVRLPPEQVFEMVADVERYPEFLPSWQLARVISRDVDAYDTEQTVGIGLLARHFQTHTTLERPRRIQVTSHDQLFRRFEIVWEFQPAHDGGCRIDFALEFSVGALALAVAFDLLMIPTASSMVSAFERRARFLSENQAAFVTT